MQRESNLSATEAFALICNDSPSIVAIDVRSPGEFDVGHFSGSINLPILNNEHRHLIGLTYKQQGNEQAQALGHQLVSGKYKEQMIQRWCASLESSPNNSLVFCWRGGLRSQLAQEWISQAGQNVLRVEGGYKALRKIALETIARPRDYLILGGPTGSGKTVVLKKIRNHVDLEALANHRGSVFGLRMENRQPTQINFENKLAQEFFKTTGPILLEDESRLIGSRSLDQILYNRMAVAPMIALVVDLEERAKNIYNEYVLDAQGYGHTLSDIHNHYSHCINKIRKSLGGLQADNCLKLMNSAFSYNDLQAHLSWISLLLETYYDKRYSYTLTKKNRKIIHQGDTRSCLDFLKDRQMAQKP